MRPIDADALLEKMKRRWERFGRESDCICLIEDAPTIDAVPVVFCNDPYVVVYRAFRDLYPNVGDVDIAYDYDVVTTDATNEKLKGVTIFPDDGSAPQIRIDCTLPVDAIAEILAHELAHVAVGKLNHNDKERDHDERWEQAFDAIYNRFCELQGFGKEQTDDTLD